MSTDTPDHDLVSSADVNGTDVFSPTGDNVGHIDHLMIDKASGKIVYAVMGFGGFLGMGEEHHPVPWAKLTYDTARDGYVTDITEEQLRGAPERPANWTRDRDYHARAYDHWSIAYPWY